MADNNTISLDDLNSGAPRTVSLDDLNGRAAPASENPNAVTMTGRVRLPPMPTATGPGGPLRFIDNMARMAAQGASFGFADEIAAGGNAALGTVGDVFRGQPTDFSGRYDRNLAEERARNTQVRQENPIAAPVAELGGGVLGGIATANAAPAVFGISKVASLPRRIWEGMRAGTAGGALGGAGNAEGGFDNRLRGAQEGATIGGVVGGLVPPVASTIGAVAMPVLRGIRNLFGAGDAERQGLTQILQAFQRDGITPEVARAQLEQWAANGARPETLVDLGGPNVRSMAQRFVNIPGAARAAGEAARETRVAGQGDRVAADMRQNFGGTGQEFHPTLDALDTARREGSRDLYAAAYSNSVPPTADLAETLRRINGVAPTAVREATALGRGEGFRGPATAEGGVSTQWLDYVKRHLDDLIQTDRTANMGRLSNRGRIINNLRVDLLGAVDTANPEYAAARAAYAGPSRLMEAMDQGRAVFREDADLTAAAVRGMPASERDAFRLGVVRAIRDRMEGATDGRNAVSSFFRNPAMRSRIEAAFDNPQDFARFEDAMTREMNMARNNQFMNPNANSMTHRMGAEEAAADPRLLANALRLFATGHPVRGTQQLGAMAFDRLLGARDETANVVGPLLFNTNVEGNRRALGLLESEASRRQFDRLRNQNRLLGTIGGTAGLLSPPAR